MIKYINFVIKLWGPFKNSQKFAKTFVRIFRMGIMKKFIYLIIYKNSACFMFYFTFPNKFKGQILIQTLLSIFSNGIHPKALQSVL